MLRERAYKCWEKGCDGVWFEIAPTPSTNCPYCGSTLISFEVRQP